MRTSNALRWLPLALLLALLTGCSSAPIPPAPPTIDSSASSVTPSSAPAEVSPEAACPVTEPEWAKPPEDPAVQGTPDFGYYFVNPDRSMWAAAWWTGNEEFSLRAGDEDIKIGWFRPEGATLEITGRRIDGDAPPLHTHVPCCYPTRFQATGLYFPKEGCWEITAKAETASSRLSFGSSLDGVLDHTVTGTDRTILYGTINGENTFTVIAIDSAGNNRRQDSNPLTVSRPRRMITGKPSNPTFSSGGAHARPDRTDPGADPPGSHRPAAGCRSSPAPARWSRKSPARRRAARWRPS